MGQGARGAQSDEKDRGKIWAGTRVHLPSVSGFPLSIGDLKKL